METPVALPAGDMGRRLSLEAPGGATRAAGRLALPPDALTASLSPPSSYTPTVPEWRNW